MQKVLAVGLMALAGFLLGGAWTTHKQGGSRATTVVLGVLAAVSLAAGLAWLYGGD